MNLYERVSDQLKGRCANRRKIDNNTYAERRENGVISIHLHATDIMMLHPDGSIVLNSGGWLTATTKARMNDQLASGGWRVWSERGVWYVGRGGWDNPNKKQWAYDDGMILLPDGTVTGEGEDPKAMLKLKKRIKKFTDAYMVDMFSGKAKAPDAGDCFMCQFDMPSGTDHLISHMEESYFVPSLMLRAIIDFPVSRCARSVLGQIWGGPSHYPEGIEKVFGGSWGAIAREQLGKALRRYITRRFGMQA